MKLDLDRTFKTLSGQEIEFNGKLATLEDVLYLSCTNDYSTETGQPITIEQKFEKYQMAKKIKGVKRTKAGKLQVEVTTDEAIKLKKWVGGTWNHIELVGQICEMIDNG